MRWDFPQKRLIEILHELDKTPTTDEVDHVPYPKIPDGRVHSGPPANTDDTKAESHIADPQKHKRHRLASHPTETTTTHDTRTYAANPGPQEQGQDSHNAAANSQNPAISSTTTTYSEQLRAALLAAGAWQEGQNKPPEDHPLTPVQTPEQSTLTEAHTADAQNTYTREDCPEDIYTIAMANYHNNLLSNASRKQATWQHNHPTHDTQVSHIPTHGSTMLLGDRGSAPLTLHNEMENMARQGKIPITSLETRQRAMRCTSLLAVPKSLAEARDYGYIGPNIPPPAGLRWEYRHNSWQLLPKGG